MDRLPDSGGPYNLYFIYGRVLTEAKVDRTLALRAKCIASAHMFLRHTPVVLIQKDQSPDSTSVAGSASQIHADPMMIPAYTIPEQPDRLILIRYNHIQSPRAEEVSHSNCPAIQNQCTTNRGSHFTESAGAIIQPELIFLITGKSPAVHCGQFTASSMIVRFPPTTLE